MAWLIPIPLGLLLGHLHLTWGNLSFHPEAKRALLGWGLALTALLAAALRIGVRLENRRPLRQVASAALSVQALLIGVTALRSDGPIMGWLPGSAVELGLLGLAAAALHRLTASPAGPAVAAAGIWMTRTAGMTFADGPFDGIGMIVTTATYALVGTVGWPLALTGFVTWRTLAPRRSA